MNKVVVDSSVAIKWFVPQPYSDRAQRILDEYQAGKVILLAPDLINAEVGNIVWKIHNFQGLAIADAKAILDAFQLLPFQLTPTADLLNDAFGLAATHKRTVYDSLYVALSEREHCPFVTTDKKLVNAIGAHFPNVIWIGNWP